MKSEIATFFEAFPNGVVFGNTLQRRRLRPRAARPGGADRDRPRRRWRRGFAAREYAPVAQSLGEIGIHSAIDLFATYAGRGQDLRPWLKDADINRDRNLRLQYLAGLGLNLRESALIYNGMLGHRRFPDDLFVGSDVQKSVLQAAIEGGY